jgi:hypothetical protein
MSAKVSCTVLETSWAGDRPAESTQTATVAVYPCLLASASDNF